METYILTNQHAHGYILKQLTIANLTSKLIQN
jgi:hypothetical protein